jgi:hypothetical protein
MLLQALARREGATLEDLAAAVDPTADAALAGMRFDVVHELGYSIGSDPNGRLHLVPPPGVKEILTSSPSGVGSWLRERFEEGERDYHDLARRARALFGGRIQLGQLLRLPSRQGSTPA